MNSRALLLALLLLAAMLPAGAADFYVARDGDDNADGSIAAPFATLERARDAVRALRNAEGVLPEACNVFVRGKKMTGEGAGPTPEAGPTPADDLTYVLDGSFALGAEDSGVPNARVTYRAYPGEEVRIAGGRAVTGFAPVAEPAVVERIDPAARDHVLQCDLTAQGIEGWGDLPASFRGGAGMLELFFDDQPMTLARWPNEGFVTIEKVIDAGPKEGKGTGGIFTYGEDRASRWTNAPDLYLQGYWCHDWYEENIRVASIDTAAKQITLGAPHNYGIGGNSPRRYYAFNILEEIDQPGEWYLDRASGILYFWPPSAPEDARVWVSLVRDPLINMQDCSNVGIEGFILEVGRGSAARIEGGAHNRVAGCTIRNVNGGAISVSGGEDHGVVACDIYATGAGGVSLTGGDRATLTPCNHFVENCHIHHYARHSRTYSPAVSLNGVGCRASHNLIHDAPHMAMGFGGNDHLIEYNDIYRVCTETDDAGAIYTGRNWTTRGTLIRYNSFRDIGMATSADGMARHFGAHSVYLDDCASGTTSFGNVFIGSVMPILIGGGRENAANNNVFVRCQTAIRQDSRGLGWAKDYAAPGGSWQMYEKLSEVPYQQPPWSTRYPELAVILDNDPPQPRGTFRNNIAWGCGQLLRLDDAIKPEWMTVEGNVELPGEEGVDDLEVVRRLVGGVDGAGGFEPVPLEEVGLQIDSYRLALPEEGTWSGGDASVAQARREARHRTRRIIMNNDGNDARSLNAGEEKTPETLLSKRTSPLAGSQVDAIFYCDGVFNLYTHRSDETELRGHGDREAVDWAWELTKLGTDALQTVLEWGHGQGMEAFWSMRMNDTHDSADDALLCKWKTDHPDYLMGAKGEKFPHGGGRWSAVNYALPEVRDKVFRILNDVATRYDVDGVELDFYRHPVYFKPQMTGGAVTQAHCDLMTGLLRRVRAVTERVAAERGRPFLVAVRVPDSLGFAKGIGLDIAQWLEEDLVDVVTGGGYFQFEPWENLVALGKQYDVPVYACLSGSRVTSPSQPGEGGKDITPLWHGEARNAWDAGISGIYLFNVFNPRSELFRTLGNVDTLMPQAQPHEPITGSPGSMDRWLKGGSAFVKF